MDQSELPNPTDASANGASFGATDCGKVRTSNQDQFLIAQLNKSMRIHATSMPLQDRLFGSIQGEILLVADGMGGHAAGEKASHLAIEHFVRRLLSRVHWHFDDDPQREQTFLADLQQLVRDAHRRILHEGKQHVDQRGMGTTLTTAYIVRQKLYLVHAGDSRCYLIRDGKADQITTDHTLARQMVEAGGLKPEEEAASKWSNVLWNVLGGQSRRGDIVTESRAIDLVPGDRILLCSDGLHRYIDGQTLADVVTGASSPSECCRELIDIANQAGGEDNVTVIVSHPRFDRRPDTGDPSTLTSIQATDLRDINDDSNDPMADTLPG